jgi:hypothetical protein
MLSRLIDDPHNVPASPWTNVTDDGGLVSNSISSWLSWERVFHTWIDDAIFVQATQGDQLDSPYCSPFLGHAILAWEGVFNLISRRLDLPVELHRL